MTTAEPDGLPILPYAGTSGWSGSATSRERVEEADASGITAERQRVIFALVSSTGERGLTAKEGCERLSLPTNGVAPSLTILHKAERIARVKERRERHEIYVLPEHVNGRETSLPGRHEGEAAVLRMELGQLADLWDLCARSPDAGTLGPGLRAAANDLRRALEVS